MRSQCAVTSCYYLFSIMLLFMLLLLTKKETTERQHDLLFVILCGRNAASLPLPGARNAWGKVVWLSAQRCQIKSKLLFEFRSCQNKSKLFLRGALPFRSQYFNLYIYIYIYTHTHIYTYIHIYICIYIERERCMYTYMYI